MNPGSLFSLSDHLERLILQAQHNLSDATMEFMIRDRLSWLRFLGFELGGASPDENTICHFRTQPSETASEKRVLADVQLLSLERLFARR